MNGEIPIEQQPKPRKTWRKVLILVGIIVLIILAFFVALVLRNIQNMENTNVANTNTGSFTPVNVNGRQTSGNTIIESIDDPYKGSANASVVIVEFSDFQCPYCAQAFPIVGEIISTYGDKIKFIYRDFPNSDSHPDAQKAAEASECAHEQNKFWEMHDKMFINQFSIGVAALKSYAAQIGLDTSQFNTCLDSGKYAGEVLQDFDDAVVAGATGTPTFFINGKMYAGVIPLEFFKRIIDAELAK